MITEDYVSFETAKLLKEKGFDEKCLNFYQDDTARNEGIKFDSWYSSEYKYSNSKIGRRFSAPTLQMAMKWLREEHKIYIRIIEDVFGQSFGWETYQHSNCIRCLYYEDAYEKACDEAIKYCLENLI